MKLKEVTGQVYFKYGEKEIPAENVLVYCYSHPEEQFSQKTNKNGFFVLQIPEDETKLAFVSPDLASGKQTEVYTIPNNPNWRITLVKKVNENKKPLNFIPLYIIAIVLFLYFRKK